jgi:signal transduction protein with GAF and PtsI domain
VLQLIQRIVPFDAATLYLLDSDGKCLAEKATLGGRVEILTILRLDTGTGLSAWTARNKKPILLDDRSRKSDFDPQNDYATIMSVPLLVENEVLGVLNLGCRQSKSLSDKHVKLMTIIAAEKLSAVSELSVSINHEINNPLAVIVGNVQCMMIQCKNLDQKSLSRLRRVEEAAIRIGEINRKLLMIDSLVSEQYMESDSARMINLEKSISH